MKQDVLALQTIVPVRFGRAEEGPPRLDAPEVDDRGYGGAEPEPATGITEGDTVRVAVVRQSIDATPEARLVAVSAGPETVAVQGPPHGILPPAPRSVFQLRGVRGGEGVEPRRALVEIRHGNASGPILGRLRAHVFCPLALRLVFHPVKIKGVSGEAGSAADLKAVAELVRAIWRPCGIAVATAAPRPEEAVFARAGVAADGPFSPTQGLKNTELDRLLGTGWVPEAINVYLVGRLGSGSTVQGFTRRAAEAHQLRNPGIVVAEADAAGAPRSPFSLASDVAHEIGHFLGLSHPERRSPPLQKEDAWSRRSLMHPHQPLLGRDPWPRTHASGQPYAERPRVEDVGYGPGNRGCRISLRNVPRLAADGEGVRARRALVQGEVY